MTMPTKFFVFLMSKPERKNAIFFKYHSGKSGMPTKTGINLYPFGYEMPGRSIGSDFAYNFNGKRTDKWNGDNGSYLDFGARIHDARLGRFFTPDPAKSGWSFEAPYIFAGKTPIQAIDENGEKIYFVN
jgi:RHS repeat-associated protein